MAIYIGIDKIEENINFVVYQYCVNQVDWGEFTVDKTHLTAIKNIKLAKNDENMRFLFKAFSAVLRDFRSHHVFPHTTCYAA